MARPAIRHLPFRIAVGCCGVLTVAHAFALAGLLDSAASLELSALDLAYRARSTLVRTPVDPRLVLIAYDEETERAEERYPSPRHVSAEILERLGAARPRVVFFDFRISTPYLPDIAPRIARLREGLSSRKSLAPDENREFRSLENDLAVDLRVARALASVPVILPYSCSSIPIGSPEEIRTGFLEKAGARPLSTGAPAARTIGRVLGPLPEFLAAAAGLGHSCEYVDSDAVLRNDPTLLALRTRDGNTSLLPSVSLVLAEWAVGRESGLVLERDGVRVGDRHVPIYGTGQTLIGYSGPQGDFRARGRQGTPSQYSAADLLAGRIPRERLEDRVILVGAVSPMRDLKRTPMDSVGEAGSRMPGIEKIAMQVDSILTARHPPNRPPWARFGFLVTALAGCAAAAFGAYRGFYASLALLLPGALLLLTGSTAAFVWSGLWIDGAFPALAWSTCLLTAALLRYSQEIGTRRFIETAFERYLPAPVVRALLKNPGSLDLAGEERELTILFADLRGFTAIAEHQTPARVVALLNEHLTSMAEAIQRHGGTVDKFVGDEIMAFWGAPLPDPSHALHACQGAKEMLRVLDATNEQRFKEGRPLLEIGIGINTGRVIVGNVGSKSRLNYTVVGDAVNVASRLQTLTKERHLRMLVGERTRELAGDRLTFSQLGRLPVKGRAEPVPVYGLDEVTGAFVAARKG